MKAKFTLICSIIVMILLCASCTSLPPEEAIKDEQSRYQEQLKRYPDRDSIQQQKEAAEQARKDDMLKKK